MSEDAPSPGSIRSAVAHRDAALVRQLIAQGATLEERDGEGITPFLFACITDQFVIALDLLRGGADEAVIDRFGRSPVNFLETSRVAPGGAEDRARRQIIEELAGRGYPFPPPDRAAVRQLRDAGNWPPRPVRSVHALRGE